VFLVYFFIRRIAMAESTKNAPQRVTMTQDKVCKTCLRFKGEGAGSTAVGASFYLQMQAYEALGKPKKIVLSVESA
jgi:hypothetical protein